MEIDIEESKFVGHIDVFKIIMSFMTTVMTAALIYCASTLVNLQITSAEQARDLATLSLTLQEIKKADQQFAASRYTAEQARSDWRLQENVDDQQDARLERAVQWAERLSDRLADIESTLRKEKQQN